MNYVEVIATIGTSESNMFAIGSASLFSDTVSVAGIDFKDVVVYSISKI